MGRSDNSVPVFALRALPGRATARRYPTSCAVRLRQYAKSGFRPSPGPRSSWRFTRRTCAGAV